MLNDEKKKTAAEQRKNLELQKKLESTQEELMKTQIRYQKEIEKLEIQNRELRKQLLLKANSIGHKSQLRKIKKSLIDMYSEVLGKNFWLFLKTIGHLFFLTTITPFSVAISVSY